MIFLSDIFAGMVTNYSKGWNFMYTSQDIFGILTVLDATPDIWKLLIRIACAIVAGFAIGFESRSRWKDAGIKTQTLLCFTACLLMIISKYGFFELSKLEGIQYDASRVSSTIISGLCFIGAAMVFNKQNNVKGLTTAVGLCLTIAIGMCFGSGLMVTGGIVTVVSLFLQRFLHNRKGIFQGKKLIMVNAKFYGEDGYIDHFKEIFGIDHFLSFKITKEGEKSIIEVEFIYKIKISSEELFNISKNEPQIIMLEKY